MGIYLVEFYDRDYLDNIISLLHRHYDGIYFVLRKDAEVIRKDNLKEFVKSYFNVPVNFIKIDDTDLENIVSDLSRILNDEDEFDFDVTGGCELLAVALGVIISQNRYKINVHKYSVIGDRLLFNYNKNSTGYDNEDERALIKEVIGLNGGKLISEDDYHYDDKNFRNEVLRLWDAIKNLSNEWNRFCSLSSDKIAEKTYIRRMEKKSDYSYCMRIMRSLHKYNIVEKYEFYNMNDKQYLRYTLSNKALTNELYFKAGSSLETYGAVAVYECGIFKDVHNSVQIDLNGIITGRPADPRNEIDIMMLYRHVPVFVSCKNTQITKEYLYEIKIMAKQYGGKYGVAMILSSRQALEPVVQRAQEMGVILIDDVAQYSLSELKEKLLTYFPQYENERN